MKKSELLEFINKETNGKFTDFKLAKVTYSEVENLAIFRFVHLNDATEQDRQTLTMLIKKFLNNGINILVKFHKAFIDEDICVDFIKNYVMTNYPNVYAGLNVKDILVKINGNDVNITIKFPQTFYNFLSRKAFDKELYSALKNNFFNNFTINLEMKENVSLANDLNKWKQQIDMVIANTVVEEDVKYQVSDLKTYIGNEMNNCVTPINKLKPEMEGTVIAGKIRDIQKRTFVRKNKKTNEDEERTYFNFQLKDGTGEIKCVFFPNKTNMPKFEALQEGQELALYGDIDGYNGHVSMKVKSIATCSVVAKTVVPQEKTYKEVCGDYLYIKPEEYVVTKQSGLFDVTKPPCDFIQNNEFVVFDLETTGLSPTEDEIVEVGAVKIKNGKICETFSTLVKPKKPIPADATKVHGITDQMVKDCPGIEKVLPDFLKFIEGTYLVAYNIDFDYSFTSNVAKKLGYKLNNKQIDAMVVAKNHIPSLRNYTLKSVVKALNITLENAHRAINDTIATAKAFLELGDYAEKFVK